MCYQVYRAVKDRMFHQVEMSNFKVSFMIDYRF